MASVVSKTWEDTWKWLQNTKWGWVVPTIGGGLMGGIFVGDSLGTRILAGFVGAIIAIILTFGITFIVHLIIAPSRLRKEKRRKFIEYNASYVNKIIGNPVKEKHLAILDTLKSMVNIENMVADSIAGKHILTRDEFMRFRTKLNKQIKLPSIPLPEQIKILYSGNYLNKVNEAIYKLGLQQTGNKPTENQVMFFINYRSVADEFGIGIGHGLKKSEEYTNLLQKFAELVPIMDDNTPDWITHLLTVPSGMNSIYLLWTDLAPERRIILFPKIPEAVSDFKNQRESTIKIIVEYAEKSIGKSEEDNS